MSVKPWDRRKGESDDCYRIFLIYRDFGDSRTVEKLSDSSEKSLHSIRAMSVRHKWVERCIAWDNYLRSERDKIVVAEARKWEKRRQQALEKNWDAAQKLRDKLDKMLAWPIQRQTSQDGKTIIEPARWSFQTAMLIAKTIAEIEVAVITAAGNNLDSLTDDQARAYARDGIGSETS